MASSALHARLSIVDPHNGAQPVGDASGRFVLTFNGEIYEHRRMACFLERRGISLRSRCDSEVLVEWMPLLHGSAEGQPPPFPCGVQATGCVTGMPSAV